MDHRTADGVLDLAVFDLTHSSAILQEHWQQKNESSMLSDL